MGSVLVTVEALDLRQLGTPIVYEIASGNEDGVFSLDPGTGSLSLLVFLDFETRQTHGLSVTAIGSSGQIAMAAILVFVSDVNDNAPVFSQASYSGVIVENAPPHTSILQVSATDRDSSLGGVVTYSLVPSSDDFMINSSSGQLATSRALDFETAQTHSLTVLAIDSGVPALTATVQVTVRVLDENDVRPSFPENALSAEISELRGMGSSIIQVQASDPDTPILTYSLVDGNDEGNFEIDDVTGLVFLRSPLDFELTSLYSLVVSVSDGVGAPSEVTIFVQVLDENDNAPQFVGTPYSTSIPEDTLPGMPIITISANDSDSGDNAAVSYTIVNVSPAEAIFAVDSFSGVITITSGLDFERRTAYQILVAASDQGTPAQSTSTVVQVSVSDINDNAPRFSQSNVTVSHPEGLPSGSQIAVLVATDADSGTNSQIRYSLQHTGGAVPFEIDAINGVVSLQESLDYETDTEYQLEVVAEDSGSPSLTATATLTVFVLDRNDNPPSFAQDQYSVAILETHVVGSMVLQVIASDGDSGSNAALSYSITAGNLNKAFVINATSGVISLANPVDFEQVPLYNLSVAALNFLATNQLATAVMVRIEVLEVNEFPPVFPMSVYEVSVLENQPAGRNLVGVAAMDLDGGAGGQLSYEITSGNDGMAFQVLPDGTLSTLTSLDREQQASYNLTITVIDGGLPALSTSTSILVTVLDINDSPPTFLLSSTSSYTASVGENAVPGTDLVLTPPLGVADDDEPGTANSDITFRIASGDPGGVFTVNSMTGQLQVMGDVDFERNIMFELVLEAADSGDPSLSSTAMLVINILDANDNPPRVSDSPAQLIFTEGQDRLLLLPNVTVTDADSLPLSLTRASLTAVGTLSGGQVGVLSLGMAPPGIVASTMDGGQTIQLTGSFSPLSLTALLRTLSYSNQDAEPDPSPRTLTLLVADGNFQTSFQLSLLLELVNDNVPQLDLDVLTPGSGHTVQFLEEGGPVAITGMVAASDQDRDTEGIASVTVSLTNPKDSEGLVLTAAPPSNFQVQYLDDNHTLIITSSPPASFEAIQLLIQSISYQNSADEPAPPLTRTIQVSISDGLLTSAPALTTVNIALTDDPPVISLGSSTDIFVNFVEGAGPVSLSSGLSLADSDSPELVNATVTLEPAPDGASEALSLSAATSPTLTIATTAHSIQIQGPASLADFSSVLSSVRYDNVLRSPAPQVRRAVFEVSDGTSMSQATAFVSFDLVNDPPALDLNGPPPGSDLSLTFAEGSPPILITSESPTVTDVDSALLEYVTIQLTTSPDGTLEGLSIASTAPPELAITASPRSILAQGPASSAAFASFLSTISYSNSAEEPTPGDRVVLFLASDGELNSTVASSIITVQSVNDPPLLLLNDGSVYEAVYVEEAPPTPIVSPVGVVLRDNDNTSLSHLSVIINNLLDGNAEILGFTDPSNDQSLSVQSTAGMESNSRSVQFQFSAASSTLENFAAVISSLNYRSTSLEPTAGTRDFRISVNDGLTNSASQLSRVNISLLNDNPPVFQRFAYQGRVLENAVDVIVTTVLASDADSSEGQFADQGIVRYQILSGNDEGTFQIDPSTGAISVRVPRDREASTVNPVLTVQAFNPVELATPTALPTAFVIITVADVNDNSPQFLGVPYLYQVTEHAQLGTLVGVVMASDDDVGSNSEVEYSIVQGNFNSVFAIGRDSGEISVASSMSLDRERAPIITLSVTATDGGSPQTSNTSLVAIELLDINDNAPEFSALTYTQSVPESVGVDVSVLTVAAMDADATSNADVVYSLSGTSVFEVNNISGLITTLAPLDRESVFEHRFTVTATDAGLPSLSATAQVVITVLDQNDNGPVFQLPAYSVSVLESVPVGQPVGEGVVATDLDSGSNAVIRYSILDQVPFTIGTETGLITISASLDREDQDVYNFTVTATDTGSPARSASVPYTVAILDANDNSPMFLQAAYSAQLQENAPTFTTVGTIEAQDRDEGRNALVSYSLVDGRGTFLIDSVTGEVFTIASVDFEQLSLYVLDIQASDDGVPPLSSITTLSIAITDENDNVPIFDVSDYRFAVAENLGNGVIGGVSARDDDNGSNADITYSITDSEVEDIVFQVDAMSGILSLVTPLDREMQASYNFSIIARDSGTSPLSSLALVSVTVLDVNDNPPVFSQPTYSTTRSEDITTGSTLLAVQATDQDIGANGDVTYRLVMNGSSSGLFGLDESSGRLVLAASLDAESAVSHILQVVASDSGTPEQTATATVVIMVTDVNDAPVLITSLAVPVGYVEDSPPVPIAPDLTVSDGDVAGSILNATVELLPPQGCCHEIVLPDTVLTLFPNITIELSGSDLTVLGPTSSAIASQILSTIQYTNMNSEPMAGSLVARFAVTDGVFSDTVDVTISISTVNDNAPVVALDGPNANYSNVFTEDGPSVSAVGVVSISDADSGTQSLHSVTVMLSNGLDGALEALTAEPSGLVSVFPRQGHTLILSGPAPIEDFVSSLASLRYMSSADAPQAPLHRVVEVIASDGQLLSDTQYSIINILPINDPPSLALSSLQDYNTSFTEQGPPARLSDGNLRLSDPDSPELQSAEISISDVLDSGSEFLLVSPMTSLDVLEVSDTELIVVGPASLAAVASVLRSLMYLNNATTPSPGVREVTFTVSDGNLSSVASAFVRVVLVNDPPSLDLNGPSLPGLNFVTSFTEGGLAVNITSNDASIADSDDATLTSVSAGIAELLDGAAEALSVPSLPEGILSTFSGGRLELRGEATIATYTSLLRSVQYVNTAPEPSGGSRLLEVVGSDGRLQSQVVTSLVEFTLVNDPPQVVLDQGGDFSTIYLENSPAVSIVNGRSASVMDVDSPTLSHMTLEARNLLDGDMEELNFTDATTGLLVVTTETQQGEVVTYNLSYPQPMPVAVFNQLLLSTEYVNRAEEPNATLPRLVRVVVSDGELASQPVTSTIAIRLIDDNEPLFSEPLYTFDISEDVSPGVELGTVVAMDADIGDIFLYQIASGDVPFSVDSVTGVVSVTGSVDRERQDLYTVSVRLTRTTPPFSLFADQALLVVNILDINDNTPLFNQTLFSLDAEEDVPPGTVIATLEASDMDADSNAALNYSLQDTSAFDIDSLTGDLFTLGGLDRELTPTYQFTVTVTDGGSPALSSTAAVRVDVLDINDVTPQFQQSSYSAELVENTAVGTSVIQLSARDGDLGSNAELLFSLSPAQSLFAVDPVTGVISTADTLVPGAYNLTATVSDGGAPQLSSTAPVSITVNTFNSTLPTFSLPLYRASVLENSAAGVSVVTVAAADPITGGVISYTATDTPFFAIHPSSGLITTTATALDREVQDNHQLQVTATSSDGERMGVASVSIMVLDANDFPPVFTQSSYSFNIVENNDVGVVLGGVLAVDSQDVGTNAEVVLYLSSNANFSVDPRTGIVSAAVVFDREAQDEYSFTVSAVDGGTPSLSSGASVVVSVLDTNDEAPVFSQASYQGIVAENQPVGTPVLAVMATDDDLGLNAAVSYSANSTIFAVDSQTGLLSTLATLDFENGPTQYNVSVLATDSGSPVPLSSVVMVTIVVRDIDDSPPVFSMATYFTSAQEEQLHTSILRVVAMDTDSLPSNAISYAIAGGDSAGRFAVSPAGVISVEQPLDRENASQHTLTIQASNLAASGVLLSSVATVNVEVLDINDNSPMFLGLPYSFSVSEAAPPDTLLASLSATDEDSTSNANIGGFSITDGNTGGEFSLDPQSGILRLTNVSLDREATERYDLVVAVSDNGSPPLLSLTNLTITILDVNDEPPTFRLQSYTVRVNETTPIGVAVFTAAEEATDSDLGTNADLLFSLQDQTTDFAISSDGILTVANALDFETQPSYSLVLLAEDRGIPSLAGMTVLNINILDEGDEPIQFVPESFVGGTFENSLPGTIVLTVLARDPDTVQGNPITYSIQQQPLLLPFSIDSQSGVITVSGSLDREAVAAYSFTVLATNTPGTSASATVTVDIMDINDITPQFLTPLEFQLSEALPAGFVITQILAFDGDEGSNGEISLYGLEGASSVFAIDPNNGTLTLEGALDFEDVQQYTFNVTAADSGSPPLIGRARVRVDVTDVNDNAPQFSRDSYQMVVSENTPIGSAIFTPVALDADSGTNGQVSFSLAQQSAEFSIDPATGEVATAAQLFIRNYTVLLLARDAGSLTLTSMATLVVMVTDANEPPEFSQPSYSATIPEDRAVNSFVIQVTATDPDSGVNSDLSYSIDPQPLFSIDVSTGRVTVSSSLDFELQQSYTLSVYASDNGIPSLNTSAQLTVQLTDANDNAPSFSQASYSATVPEDTVVGSTVVTVSATDTDSTSNAAITYSISQDSSLGAVAIDSPSGAVFLIEALDFESIQTVRLMVQARDGGSPFMLTSVPITLSVSDVDDSPPVFSQDTPFLASVEEDLRSGTTVVTVLATDGDEGQNAAIQYSLVNSTGLPFAVNSLSGEVLITSPGLDREEVNQYSLVVEASNPFSPTFTATASIFVTVLDSNDNLPQFDASSLQASAPESSAAGSLLGRVIATDADIGNNSLLIFTFDPPSLLLSVSPLSGEVRVEGPLDFETTPTLDLTVVATDSGMPALSAAANYRLTVLNVNDEAPKLTSNPARFSYQEGSPPVGIGGGIALSDADGLPLVSASAKLYLGSVGISPPLDDFIQVDLSQSGAFGLTVSASTSCINITGSGTMQAYMSLLTRLQFGSAAEEPVSEPRLVAVDVSDGVFASDTLLITVAVQLINDNNPVLDLSLGEEGLGYQTTFTEGGIFVSLVGTDASLSDLDGDSIQSIRINLTNAIDPEEGLDSFAFGGITVVRRDSGLDLIGPASATDFEFLLQTVYYENAANEPSLPQQARVVSFVASDGIRESLPAFATITILLVNDAPSIRLRGVVSQDAVLVYSETQPSLPLVTETLAVSDVDSELLSFVNVTIINFQSVGDQLLYSTEGYNITAQFLSGTLLLTGPAAAEDFTAVLLTLQYVNNFLATDQLNLLQGGKSVQFSVSDGALTSNLATAFITFAGVNDPPIVDLNGPAPGQDFEATFVEGDSEVNVTSPLLTVTDVDSTELMSVAAVLSGVQDQDNEVLAVTLQIPGLVELFNLSTNQLTLQGTSSSSNYELLLRSLVYRNMNPDPTPGVRVVTIAASDGEDTSSSVRASIAVSALNDPPQLTLTPVGVPFVEEGVAIPLVGDVIITDPDNLTLSSVSVQLEDAVDGRSEFLFIADDVEGLFQSGNQLDGVVRDLVFTFAPASLGTVQAFTGLLQQLHYNNTALEPSAGTRRVNITMSDGQLSSDTISVVIEVDLINDNAPVFSDPVASVMLAEDAPLQSTIFQATASDEDADSAVSYSIDPSSPFTISATSGLVILTGSVDRELVDSYSLTITASDGVHSAAMSLRVEITDINDNTPEFAMSTYTVSVEENTLLGTPVLTVDADDADLGSNAVLTFSIRDGNAQRVFAINETSGELSISGPVDFESVQSYRISLMAADAGTPQQTSRAFVLVQVTDLNDNEPVFSPDQDAASFAEDTSLDTVLYTVQATDGDADSQLLYSLSNGTSDLFAVDSISGQVFLAENLDFESESAHVIVVEASDETFASSFTLTLGVSDVDDNDPVFVTDMYAVTIPENANISTDILAGEAALLVQDRDTGPNAAVQFVLVSGDPMSQFALNALTADSAQLILAGGLDREVMADYVLILSAVNPTTPSRNATALVAVTITDVNDSPPEFDRPLYSFSVAENVERGTVLGQVSATDADEGSNAAIQYSILSDDFNITSSGEIVLASTSLDFELSSQISLVVFAVDGGTPSLSAQVMVMLAVQDANDNAPMFTEAEVEVDLPENTPPSTTVAVLTAQDSDTGVNAEVCYSISQDNATWFQVDPVSGVLTTTSTQLDFESDPEELLVIVTASDGGTPSLSSTSRVLVTLLDINEFAPTFTADSTIVQVSEDHQPSTPLLVLGATDSDGGIAGVVEYRLLSVTPLTPAFIIDNVTGELSTTSNTMLDREDIDTYVLTVQASNPLAFPLLSTLASVTLSVLDVNDNPPIFSQDAYSVAVTTNIDVGDAILTVSASDADLGANGTIRYSISNAASTVDGQFNISASTGVIVLASALTSTGTFQLTIMAADQGFPSLSSNVTATINVIQPLLIDFSQQGAGFLLDQPSPTTHNFGLFVDTPPGSSGCVSASLGNITINTSYNTSLPDATSVRGVVLNEEVWSDDPEVSVVVQVTDDLGDVHCTPTQVVITILPDDQLRNLANLNPQVSVCKCVIG